MIVTRYYTSNEDLNKSEEPYRSVVGLLDQLYTDVPEGCAVLNLSSFSLYHAVSAVRTIYENLKKNILTFNNTLLSTYKATKASYSIMRFDNFCLTSSRQVVLFGAVYYVAAQDLNFSNKHLKQIENISCSDKPSTAMFQYFKEPADKLREELLSHTPSGQVGGTALPVVENDSSKRIVLTNQSDMARVVKAMAMNGYFKHADGSTVSEAEVGRWFCTQFCVKSSWDSLVQSAFKVEDISGTFDTLKDKAVQHYKKVNKIKD